MVSSLVITRISDPTETAAVIAFLASPAASYMTGAGDRLQRRMTA
jgi:NAD(P)-dependent dehydrogenase (short-subunit alcohol dehydrogenase family)